MFGLAVLISVIWRIACYLGIGAFFYYIFVGAAFDVHSMLMWAWLLAWPFIVTLMLISLFGAVALIVLALLALALPVLTYYLKIKNRRLLRKSGLIYPK